MCCSSTTTPTTTVGSWIGDDPKEMSVQPRRGLDRQARLVDAAIRSAVEQDVLIHIIPSTGPEGPADDIAGLIRSARVGDT